MKPLVLAAALAVACAPAPAERRPDLLLVSVDTLRADRVSAYGSANDTTPFLDAMAAEGVRFELAHAPSTNTTPSHMSLFTGLDPMTHGVHPARPSNKPTAALSDRVPTLPEVLRDAGWQTASFTDRGGMPPSIGFGRGFESVRSQWESLADKVDACAALVASAGDAPLFVFFHTYEVHAPYLPPRDVHGRFADGEYDGRFRKRYENTVDLPVAQAWDQKAHFLSRFDELGDEDVAFLSDLYDEGVAHTDRELARLWAEWSEHRDAANTLLVVLSDHGEEFLEHDGLGHKFSLHAELVRVPLIVRGPGVGHGVVARPVSLTGVMPTILDLFGLEVPSLVQEESFADDLRDPSAGIDGPPVFTQTNNKLHVSYESVAVGTKRLLRITRKGKEELALYDWAEDPFEQRDVSDVHDDEVGELVRLLDRRRTECERLHAEIGPNPELTLSAEEIEELQALGYTDSEEAD